MSFEKVARKLLERNQKHLENTKILDNIDKLENDMANYLPKIEPLFSSTVFKLPNTIFITVPKEVIVSVYNSDFSDEERITLNKELRKAIEEWLWFTNEFFIKTGTFSDKFDFSQPHVKDLDTVFSHYVNILYQSLLVGAGVTNTLVVREYIKPSEAVPTIYGGMPLREEWRVFVDFDSRSVIGYSFYWHESQMVKLVGFLDDADKLSIDELYSLAKTSLGDYTGYRRDYLEYFISWYSWRKGSNFDKINDILDNLSSALESNKSELIGKWSLDFMVNGEDIYFIDAARMEESALVDVMVGV